MKTLLKIIAESLPGSTHSFERALTEALKRDKALCAVVCSALGHALSEEADAAARQAIDFMDM